MPPSNRYLIQICSKLVPHANNTESNTISVLRDHQNNAVNKSFKGAGNCNSEHLQNNNTEGPSYAGDVCIYKQLQN